MFYWEQDEGEDWEVEMSEEYIRYLSSLKDEEQPMSFEAFKEDQLQKYEAYFVDLADEYDERDSSWAG